MAKNTVLKGCLGGCGVLVLLGVVGLIGAHFVVKNLPPEQKAALKAQMAAESAAQNAQDAVPVEAFLKKFRDLRARIPAPAALQEQLCPAFGGDGVEYLAMDFGFLQQFTDQGFQPEASSTPAPWYRGQPVKNVQGALVVNAARSRRDDGALLLEQREFNHVPYLAVFVPVEQRWPTLNADGKTFQTGWFRGWVVLVDGKTFLPLGQTPFTCQNSEKVTSLRVGLGDRLVGADLKQALENDFTDRFGQAANAAIAHVCKQDGKTSFASRSDSFPMGE